VFQGLDPSTAKVRWRREFQKDVPESISKCVIHDAVAGESIVFAFAGERDVHALRTGDGAVDRFTARADGDRRIWLAASGSDAWFGAGTHVWRWSAGRSQPEASIPLATDAGSPWYAAASGTRLLLGDRDRPSALRAFDLTTGRLRWERKALPEILSMSAGDEAIYLNVSRAPRDLIAVDVNTGAELWAAGVGGFYSPMKQEGWLYANGSDAVLVVEAKTGRIARTIKAEAEVITTPVRAGDLLLFGTINGALHAVRIGG
jgi:outer membrane protein assembly factor BamB